MRSQPRPFRPRRRAAVLAVLIVLGVLGSMGISHAAPVATDGQTGPATVEGPETDAGDTGGSEKDHGAGTKDASADDPTLAAGTPCTTSADACVDLAAKHAWLIDGEGMVVRGPVPIASGAPGYETPRGTFYVQWKNRDHRSVEFDNAPMPFAVFFADGGIAFHQGRLNSDSHGCVRLGQADAEAFFDFLEEDDEVQVH